MKINHVALWTDKLDEIKDFYQKYFHACVGEKYVNSSKAFESYFLTFEDGTKLELMRNPFVKNLKNCGILSGYTHIAISTGSKEAVDKLTTEIGQDGYKIVGKPRITGDGYYESSILDCDGNVIELTI